MVELPLNTAEGQVMHIDLNSCFAMMEQQANPFLRGKPVAVTNRLVKGAIVVAASYEAKRYGIGVGTRFDEAQAICPGIILLETDPPKYIHAYQTILKILRSYSPDAQMKSVDEGVIDFSRLRQIHSQSLLEIGGQIKSQIHAQLGEWVTCNIGIAPNRWLAKVAAGLNKPDGMDLINHRNLLTTYNRLELIDLPGINRRYRTRLQLANILSVLDFYRASEAYLTRQVFHSVNGHLWYARLRGWEVDDYPTRTRTIGKQYVVPPAVRYNWSELVAIITKMCEMMGRRMRGKGYCCRGIYAGCLLNNHSYWHARRKFPTRLFTTQELATRVFELFKSCPTAAGIKTLHINTYGLEPAETSQPQLFETPDVKRWRLTNFMDQLNNRYGEFSVMPGRMANTQTYVPDKIPFGSTRYFGYQHQS
jgi:DNA polymerase IV